MASLADIQKLLSQENEKLRNDLGADIMKQVGALIDQRLHAHTEKLMEEIRDLKQRTEALEQIRAVESTAGAGCAGSPATQANPGRASKRSCPGHGTLPPRPRLTGVAARTLKLSTFPKYMTPDELKPIVDTIIASTEYERLIMRRPRADEVSVVFADEADANAFFKRTRDQPLPSFTDEQNEIHKLHWSTPDTPADRRRAFVTRRARDYLPTVLKGEVVEVNQRAGSVFVDLAPLLSIAVDDELDVTFNWKRTSVAALKLNTEAIEAHLRSLLRQ